MARCSLVAGERIPTALQSRRLSATKPDRWGVSGGLERAQTNRPEGARCVVHACDEGEADLIGASAQRQTTGLWTPWVRMAANARAAPRSEVRCYRVQIDHSELQCSHDRVQPISAAQRQNQFRDIGVDGSG